MRNSIILLCCILMILVNPVISYGHDYIIKGRVEDIKTGTPLPNTNIRIEGTSIGTISDIQGYFKIKMKQPGNYILQASYIGYKKYRQSVQLISEEVIQLEIKMRPTVLDGESVTVTATTDANDAIERETPIAFSKLDVIELKSNYTTGDLPDLIQDVPGVWTSTAGLGESEIIVRGFTSDKVRFMVNDIPMNEPEDNQVYWSNWASLSNTAQTIEVHRGPAFSLYGPAAFGGSVHIETMGVGIVPGSSFRISSGVYDRLGIEKGDNAGKISDPSSPGHMINAANAVNYTYSLRMNSGPLYNGKLNLSCFLEYKTGDSYIYGTTYDGYSLGVEAESLFRRQFLRFSFFISPQQHNQAFALQDIDLLKTIGREYNRKNHSYQENYYAKPFWSLKHEWNISDNLRLVNNAFFTLGNGADQTLVNDAFDVSTGNVSIIHHSSGSSLGAFGAHAIYLYENYGLWSTNFIPMNEDYLDDPWNQHSFMGELVGRTAVNLFTENHTHSYQRRNRRDHKQFGFSSHYQHELFENLKIIAGLESRLWRGHRESEIWYMHFSKGLKFEGRDVYFIVGDNVLTDQLQSLYSYDTNVDNFSIFARTNYNLSRDLTLQAGAQLAGTRMKVIENPIRFLDIGSFNFFEDSYRTSADQINHDGTKKYKESDYKRSYTYLTPWAGVNYNLTANLNLFSNVAAARKEPAILDWYDPDKGPLLAVVNGQKLKPETANSLETGLGFHSLHLDTKLNYYYTKYEDKIETVVDINDQRRTMNAGSAVFQGLEWELKGKYRDFDFRGTATIARNRWQTMELDTIFDAAAADVAGKVVPFAPERMVSASIGYVLEPYPTHIYHLKVRLNYWDEYYGTYTNYYLNTKRIVKSSKLPHFLDVSAQVSFTKRMKKVDLIFRIDVNNFFNRRDNYMRAQYTVDYTRNDDLAGKYNLYVLQAPLFNIFFTSEIAIR